MSHNTNQNDWKIGLTNEGYRYAFLLGKLKKEVLSGSAVPKISLQDLQTDHPWTQQPLQTNKPPAFYTGSIGQSLAKWLGFLNLKQVKAEGFLQLFEIDTFLYS